jgi:hypothetical protein
MTGEGEDDSILKMSTENIQCFCDELAAEMGKSKAIDKTFSIAVKNQDTVEG